MPNAITAVGTTATHSGAAGTTLSVSPTAVGDCFILASGVQSATVFVSSVSGGGVTTWVNLAHAVNLGAQTASYDLWLGVVTATGASTITVTGSASLAALVVTLWAQQFHGGTSPLWGVDGAQTGSKTNSPASTTITWPTLTPSGSNDLYVGVGQSLFGATASTQTAGYTMTLAGSEPFLFNPSVSTAQNPTCTNGSSSTSGTLAALIQANPVPGSPRLRVVTQAVGRASSF